MKRTIIIMIAAFIATANYSSAQENNNGYRNKLTFGLKAGINLANVYDEQGEKFNADARFGFAGGAFAAIPIGTYIGIQPEILFCASQVALTLT